MDIPGIKRGKGFVRGQQNSSITKIYNMNEKVGVKFANSSEYTYLCTAKKFDLISTVDPLYDRKAVAAQ